MSIITSEADFLREVIAEAADVPINLVAIKNSSTRPRESWPTTQAIVIGGFAVHENTSGEHGEWTATHIKTGLAGATFGSLWEALVVVGIYLGSGAPWHEIADEADLKRIDRDARQRIKDAIDRLLGESTDGEATS